MIGMNIMKTEDIINLFFWTKVQKTRFVSFPRHECRGY